MTGESFVVAADSLDIVMSAIYSRDNGEGNLNRRGVARRELELAGDVSGFVPELIDRLCAKCNGDGRHLPRAACRHRASVIVWVDARVSALGRNVNPRDDDVSRDTYRRSDEQIYRSPRTLIIAVVAMQTVRHGTAPALYM